MIKNYTELQTLSTLEDRFKYLSLRGRVGASTFGSDRWMNQRFYTSREWRQLRKFVIIRDNGCDLGVEGYEIHKGAAIHHMNPVRLEDLIDRNLDILDPEFLITTSHNTHNAIHYGDVTLLPTPPTVRTAGDTKLWNRS